MTASPPRQSPVLRARNGLSIEHDAHVSTLVASCRAALSQRDGLVAWLTADRLCRITGGREATPFLLRSAALAMLADSGAAQRDIEAAIAANPEQPEVLEIMLRGPDSERRATAARHLAPRPDALAVLAQQGASGFLRFRREGDMLEGQGFWNGDQRLGLTFTHDHGTLAQDLEGEEAGAGSPFRWQAGITLPWPGEAHVVAIAGDRPALHVEPPLLRAFPPPPPPTRRKPRATAYPNLMVIVPVHSDLDATRLCFEFLGAIRPSRYRLRIVAVDDATPEPEIAALLDQLATEGRIILLRHRFNLGFAASVNHAMRLREPGEDVLLLNSDAYLPQGALETLRKVALSAAGIGTVTPFSNNGEDVSLPRRFEVNPLPPQERIRQFDAIAWRANGVAAEEIPNGVGFCLYIRAPLIEAIGGLSLEYERGYFEDVDFCLRAHRAGFKNLCATGAYVGHSGSVSFGGEKRALVRRNLARIHDRFPEYRAMGAAFAAKDPLQEAARRILAADLPSLEPCRLILAGVNVPRRILMALHQGMPTPSPVPLLLRVGTPETDTESRRLELTGLDERFPGTLRVTSAAGDEPAWLAALKPEELVLVDPPALPEEIGAVLVHRAARRAIAIADHSMAWATMPAWCCSPPARLVTSAGIAQRVERHGGQSLLLRPSVAATSANPPVASPAQKPDHAVLAIIPAHGRERLRRFLEDCAGLLARAGISLAVLGSFEKDLAFLEHPNVWLSGSIEPEEIAPWLQRFGITRALFIDRFYGLADPLTDRLREQGVGVACFGSGDTVDPKGRLLDPALSAEALSENLREWLATGTA